MSSPLKLGPLKLGIHYADDKRYSGAKSREWAPNKEGLELSGEEQEKPLPQFKAADGEKPEKYTIDDVFADRNVKPKVVEKSALDKMKDKLKGLFGKK